MTSTVRSKTLLFALIIVFSNAFGNLLLAVGLRASGDLTQSPLAFLRTLSQPQVIFGVALLILWLLSRMAMLSWADLTYVLPVTAVGYVLNAALGRFFLLEDVTPARWTGTVFIVSGAVLAGLGAERKRS